MGTVTGVFSNLVPQLPCTTFVKNVGLARKEVASAGAARAKEALRVTNVFGTATATAAIEKACLFGETNERHQRHEIASCLGRSWIEMVAKSL